MKKRILKKQIRKAEKLIAEEAFNLFKGFESEKQEDFDSHFLGVLFSYLLSLRLNLSEWNTQEKWIDGLINGKLTLKLPDTVLLHSEMVWGLLADTGGSQWKESFEAAAKISKNGKTLTSYTIKFGNPKPIEEKEVKLGLYSGISIIELFDRNSTLIKSHEIENAIFEKYSGEYSFTFSHSKNK